MNITFNTSYMPIKKTVDLSFLLKSTVFHQLLDSYFYKPHFNWAPQLVHVLQPPTSATFPFRHTGHVSPISEPIVTFVCSNSWIVSTKTTRLSSRLFSTLSSNSSSIVSSSRSEEHTSELQSRGNLVC